MNIKPPFMQGSFEKEVQQKMEELRFTPSPSAWEKIENRIKPERKKRRGLYWITIVGILLLVGGWWVYSYLHDDDHKNAISEPSRVFIPSSNSQRKIEENIPEVISRGNANPQHSVRSIDQTNGQKAMEADLQKTALSRKEQKNKLGDNKRLTPSGLTEKQEIELTRPSDLPGGQEKKKAKDLVTDRPAYESKIMATIPVSPLQDSTKLKEIEKAENLPSLNPDTAALKKKIALVKKWQPRLVASAGWTSTTHSRSKALSYNSAPLSSNVPANRLAAPTTAGPGFSIGMLWAKDLSERWQFTIGVQYAHYATKTKVGDKKNVDTIVSFGGDKVAVNEYYTNTAGNTYTNRLGVIELPVQFSYKPIKTAALHFSLGASYGRVISTNALSFSSSSNIYYQNQDNEVRHQLPLHTSIQYSFGGKNFKLHTGPFFQYNLLKLQKVNTANPSHLVFAGIRTDVSF